MVPGLTNCIFEIGRQINDYLKMWLEHNKCEGIEYMKLYIKEIWRNREYTLEKQLTLS